MAYSTSVKVLHTIGVAGAAALLAASMASAQAPKPDNTGVNARDRQDQSVTADDQGNSRADLDATKKVRQAIVRDKSLSTYAHNVKVVTREGVVTLKGPVRSEAEKQAVEAKAKEVVGVGKIVSELTVAPSSKSEPAKHE